MSHSICFALAHKYNAKKMIDKYNIMLQEDKMNYIHTQLEHWRDQIEPESALYDDKTELKKKIADRSHGRLVLKGIYSLEELSKIANNGKLGIECDGDLANKIFNQEGLVLGDIQNF